LTAQSMFDFVQCVLMPSFRERDKKPKQKGTPDHLRAKYLRKFLVVLEKNVASKGTKKVGH